MLSSNFRRLLLAIIAWPAGFLAAILAMILKSVFFSGCRGGEACALEDVSWFKVLFWFAIAIGPGILATYHWWTNRRTRPNGEL